MPRPAPRRLPLWPWLTQRLAGFAKDERGSMTVEFVIWVPVLTYIGIGMFVLNFYLATVSEVQQVANELAAHMPARLAEAWAAQDPALQRPVNEAPDKALARLAERIGRWEITPEGTEGLAERGLDPLPRRVLAGTVHEVRPPVLSWACWGSTGPGDRSGHPSRDRPVF